MLISSLVVLYVTLPVVGQPEGATPPAPVAAATPARDAKADISVVPGPPTGEPNKHYAGNKSPLRPTAFVQLPTNTVRVDDWLNIQLRLLKDGFVGNLPDLSAHLRPDSGWLDSEKPAGVETAYWLRSYGVVGYLLRNTNITDITHRWLDKIVANQQPDGWLGPKDNLARRDHWPNMIALQALRARFEATKDDRTLQAITRYLRYRYESSPDALLPYATGSPDHVREQTQHARAVDELDMVYWLYNQIGEPWLLELAQRLHERSADWTRGLASRHGVDVAHGLREPVTYFQQSGDKQHLEAARRIWKTVYDEFGQMPGGMYAAADTLRAGKTGPEQPTDANAVVEMMNSLATVLRITGEPDWADKFEEIAYNTYPATHAPDGRALRGLTAPNMVQCDMEDKRPAVERSGAAFAFDPKQDSLAIHNAALGWVRLAENLWLASPDNGLTAMFYAPCEVRARVGSGVDVTITEITAYPFDADVDLKLSLSAEARFPLTLRIPGWCTAPTLSINGEDKPLTDAAGRYVTVQRAWKDGDVVKLGLPLHIRKEVWKSQNGAVSIHRGPLAYSLKLQENWVRNGDRYWPTYDLSTADAWNCALLFTQEDLDTQFEVVPRSGVKFGQIFYTTSAPHTLKAKAYVIPEWALDKKGMPSPLQKSPVKVEPVSPKEVELLPMGCTRLRLSVFPTAGTDADARAWQKPDEKSESK